MSLFKSGLWFAAGTLFSRIFGLLRESVIAGVFGASMAMDAFLVANRIPNMLRELFAEGALGSSFTKVFSEFWEKDQEKARQLLRDSLLFFSLLSLLITLVGTGAAPWLVDAMTTPEPGNETGNSAFLAQATGLTRLLFPFIGLMMVASVTAGALHQKGRFLLSAASPVALNVGYLVGALLLAPWLTGSQDWLTGLTGDGAITGLALGVLLGGLSQLGLQLWGLWKPFFKGQRIFRFSTWSGFSPGVKKVLLLMGPMVLAGSAGQVNVLVNTNFATSLGTGAVTWLNFAFRLLQLPIGIFAVAVSSVALPTFSRLLSHNTKESRRDLSGQLLKACELMLWLMTACFCFFVINGQAVISLLFEQGAFTQRDSLETSGALFCYSFGLMGYGLIKVLISYYYASGRTRFAMNISFISIFTNLLLNWLLVQHFGHRGLAMTASLVLTGNALGLIFGLRGEGLTLPGKHLSRGGIFLLLAAGVSLILSGLCYQYLSESLSSWQLNTKFKSAVILLTGGTLVTIIFGGLGCLRCRLSPSQAVARLRRPGLKS